MWTNVIQSFHVRKWRIQNKREKIYKVKYQSFISNKYKQLYTLKLSRFKNYCVKLDKL